MATTVTYTNECPCCTSGVTTPCCSGALSETLYASVSAITGGCGCLSSTVTLTYDSGVGGWTGTFCSFIGTLKCTGLNWDMTFNSVLPVTVLNPSSSCSPLSIVLTVDGTSGAVPCFGTFTLTITE